MTGYFRKDAVSSHQYENNRSEVPEVQCPKKFPKRKKKPVKKTNPVYIEAMKFALANSEKGITVWISVVRGSLVVTLK